MTINRLLYLIFFLLIFICILYVIYLQYGATSNKLLFIYIFFVAMIAIALTVNETLCFNGDEVKRWSPCREMNRLTWRRSIILAFIIFLIVNGLYPGSNLNFIVFLLTLMLLYFFFNFDQYHRFKLICDTNKYDHTSTYM